MDLGIKDKVAFITGASSGIGLATAELFAKEGAKVIICGRNEVNLKKAKDEIKKGTRLNQIMRHTLGLFHGQIGATYWKRYLSENMCVRDADVKKIDHIMDKIKFDNIDNSVGRSA